jgi:hypothetical protein
MKQAEGLQPVLPTLEEDHYDLPPIDPEARADILEGFSTLKGAMAGEVALEESPGISLGELNLWSRLGSAGLKTLIDVETKMIDVQKRVAGLVGWK